MRLMDRFLLSSALRAPDDGGAASAGAVAPADGGPAAAAAAEPAVSSAAAVDVAAPAAVVDAAAAPTDGGAAAPAADAPKPEPSLLELADSKKKPEGDAKPADPAADAPKPEDAAKPADDKKPDAKKDEPGKNDKKAEDVAAEAAPAEIPPVEYQPFTLPEGVKLDEERVGKFKEIAGAAHVDQDAAQKMVDLYVDEMQRMSKDIAEQATRHQRDTWRTLNDTWKGDLRKDTDLGGNRLETSLSIAKAVMEEYGGTDEQVRELIAHTSNNGMGNFPGFVRLLHNIGKALNVYEDGIVPSNPANPKPQKSPGNRGWYKGMDGGAPSAS